MLFFRLKHRYRHLLELKPQLNALSDREAETPEGQALLKEVSQAFVDVMAREAFIQDLRRKGDHLLPLDHWVGPETGVQLHFPVLLVALLC
jgi:hypothetical protein